jgi:predicted dehydrogenase
VTSFAMVGAGFRAAAYFRLAATLDGLPCVGAVVRSPRPLPVPAFGSLAACLATASPDFLVTALPPAANAIVLAEAVRLGIPVLSETPVAGVPGLVPVSDHEQLAPIHTGRTGPVSAPEPTPTHTAPTGPVSAPEPTPTHTAPTGPVSALEPTPTHTGRTGPGPRAERDQGTPNHPGWAGVVQVAEQYLLMPTHAARLAAVRAGMIGAPTQVQVSSTQLHHAVSLMRGMLGADVGPVTVRASRHTAPLVSPLSRTGWTDDAAPHAAVTTIAMLSFHGGKSGLYDFTDNQTRNQLRFRRILVRGTHGELQDDALVRLAGPRTIVRTPLVRDDGGISLGGRVLYRNPFPGLRLNDDEIATATILMATAAWVRGEGPPPYPLELGAHDHRVGQAITTAAETGRTVTTD